jgi:hypothetical protein
VSDGGRGAAICDANVLIDYVKADEHIFRELVAYWGTVFVPDIVLFEARQLSLTRADELGLTIIETPLALPPAPGLSKADRACLHYVLERGWTCIVNDRRLRSECIKQGGTVVWGLEMLLILASERRITKARARRIATRIKADNPLITGSIIDDFIDKLKVL